MRNLTRLCWFKRSPGLRYAVAVLGVTAAVIADVLLGTYLRVPPTLFSFLCAIILAAWFGGVGPGLAATALSVLAFDYFFLPPIYSINLLLSDLPRIGLFCTAALFVVGLIAAQRNAAQSLRRSQADLEDKVRDLEKLNAALQIEGAERRSSEEKSRRMERELQVTIDTIPASVASFEPDGSRDFVNRPWRDYTGVSSQEKARAATWATTVHPDDVEAGETEWHACLASGRVFQMDLRIRRADGEYRWNTARRVPLRDAGGNIVKWYGIAFDIDDQKRAERALRESEARLVEAKQELQLTIDMIPAKITVYQADGTTRQSSNLTWCNYAGLSMGEKAAARSWAVAHPDDVKATEAEWTACLAKHEPFQAEVRLRRRDGVYRWHMVHRVPLRNQMGNVTKWYAVAFDIEDRKRAEDALRQSEDYLEEAQRLSHTGSFGWYVSSGEIIWSAENYRIFEYAPATKVTIDRVFDRVHPDDAAFARGVIERATTNKRAFDFEHRLLMPDGSVKHLNVVARPLIDGPGELQFVGAVMDITARKLAEGALRERAQLLDLTHDTIFVRGMNDAISFWNRGAEQLYGWSTEEALGQISHQLLRTIFPAPIEEITSELLSTGRWDGELVHTKRDGTQVTVASRWSLRQDERGRPIEVLETNNDITERKRAEESLRKSEQRYRHLFQNMPIALWQLDASEVIRLFKGLRAEGVAELGPYVAQHPDFLPRAMEAVKIEEVNERMIEMLGARDASEILGSITRYCHIHPEAFLRGLESRYRGESTHQEEAKLLTLDGRVIDVLMTATRPGLITDPDMSLLGFIDISERVRAQEMLQRVQADFAHAARVSMLGELTASIAHEVNQPLAAIVTHGEVGLRLLNRSEPDLGELRELTKCIVGDARRAADVLARVRTMATRQAPEQTLLWVDEVIREALTFLRHEVQSHGLMVVHHPNPSAPKVLGDRTQLQQVFVNLTVNAVQAMAQKGVTRPTLVIRTTLFDPHSLCCTFEDSGPGIEPKHLDHLFDSFFTTKEAGMGLGLPISRSIVEAHGGYIRVDNESACGGARFSITLPAKPQRLAEHPNPS
jgi:PAS domain S-box-containing protein